MEDNSLGPIKLHKYEGDVMLAYLSVYRGADGVAITSWKGQNNGMAHV